MGCESNLHIHFRKMQDRKESDNICKCIYNLHIMWCFLMKVLKNIKNKDVLLIKWLVDLFQRSFKRKNNTWQHINFSKFSKILNIQGVPLKGCMGRKDCMLFSKLFLNSKISCTMYIYPRHHFKKKLAF